MRYAKQYSGMFSLTKMYILIVLTSRPLHVYAICHAIAQDSRGGAFPTHRGVTNAVKTLLESGYVEKTESIMLYQHPRQGATYRLTAAGLQRLKQEIAHHDFMVTIGTLRIHTYEKARNEGA